jgi:type IX secretion system PorP/SprF family membrane protein
MKVFFSISLLLFSFVIAKGQNSFQYSQYMLDKYQFNPAYGGLEYSLNVNTVVRSQWNGLPNSPKSQYINAHMPFYIWNGAVGMTLSNESGGNLRNISFSGSYNYVYASPIGLISGGASLGFLQKRIDGRALITPEGDYSDNGFNHNDPSLENTDYNGFSPLWSLGLYFAGDQFDAGISLINTPAQTFTAGLSEFSQGPLATLYSEFRYAYNDQWDIMPSLLVKSDFIETQIDFSLMGRYNGKIFGSIGIRGYSNNTLDAIIFMAGNKLSKNYTIAYSFDTGLSSIKRVNEGSHEIRLIYNLNRPIATGLPPKIIYNPRFL